MGIFSKRSVKNSLLNPFLEQYENMPDGGLYLLCRRRKRKKERKKEEEEEEGSCGTHFQCRLLRSFEEVSFHKLKEWIARGTSIDRGVWTFGGKHDLHSSVYFLDPLFGLVNNMTTKEEAA